MKFKIENSGKGPRYVPTLAGRSQVNPGEKNARTLDMDPEVARQYIAMAKRSDKFAIKISALDSSGSAELEKPLQPRERRRMPPDQLPPRRIQPMAAVAEASPYADLGDSADAKVDSDEEP